MSGMKPSASETVSVAALQRELGVPPDYAQTRGLSFHKEAEAAHLVAIAGKGNSQIWLLASAAAAWTRMSAAARIDEISLQPISGFRSVARQAEIIRRKLAAGHAIEAILRINAAPGFSEHHTGCAVDIGTPEHLHLEEAFDATPAFSWLEIHAREFGFTMTYPRNNRCGIAYEPWHWCWRERPLKT